LVKDNTRYFRIICILLIALTFSSATLFSRPKDKFSEKYRILFISSYSYSWESIPHQINGIIDALSTDQYVINYEFMDTKNTFYNNGYKEFYDILKYKLDSRLPYDGVIVGDDAALQFVMQYKEELFPNVPIVFEGIDNIENGIAASKDSLITGVIEKVDYEANLKLAHLLFPNAKNLVLIHDNMENGIGIVNQLKKATDLFADFKVEYLNSSNYTKEELSYKLSSYDTDSIVFGIAIGQQKGNIVYSEEERHAMIRNYANVPIFTITQAGVGKGMFGGYIIDHEACGYLAGEMIKSILEENVYPEIVLETPSTYYFDYNIMKDYGISSKDLPKDSLIINKPINFFQRHATKIISILISVIIIFLLISYIRTVSNRNLQVAYNQLVTAEAKLKHQYKNNQIYIKELTQKEAHIRHQAEHDYLTNLPNRPKSMQYLDKLLKENIPFTIIIVDLDDFKEINDSCGHTCGDEILKKLSDRLSNMFKEDYFFASRFGGDEFLLVVQEKEIGEESSIMHEIKKAFSKPLILEGGTEHYIKVSMGIASSGNNIKKTIDIVSNADLALHEAKHLGKNRHAYYNESMKDQLIETRKIEDILLQACENDDFTILYQPQIATSTTTVSGYEALIRLKGTFISPAKFIPIAEETDLILKIGRIVTKKVVKQMSEWRKNGLELKPVAINFSCKQIWDKGYVSYLKDLLDEHHIAPQLIEIEFTENIFLKNDLAAVKLFDDLLDLGVSLALDDFGTGYSSIRYLTYVPVKKIKLDKSLVDIFLVDGRDEFIKNLINLSHSLGLKITVEGVEEKEQYDKLKHFNCDYIQGYYFSKPISGKEIEKFNSI